MNATFESPSLPFETADFKVTNLALDAECTSNGPAAAPTCKVDVSLSFCDKGGACNGSDKSFRTGTFKAFGTGPTAFFIDGGTGSFDGLSGSFDSVQNLQNFNLENVQINLCSKNVNYGDMIFLQVNTIDRWLTGGRNGGNTAVFSVDIDSSPSVVNGQGSGYERRVIDSYKWIVRSAAGDGNRDTIDPKNGSCVKYGDKVHLQVSVMDDRWLTGGRGDENIEVFTADKFSPSVIDDGEAADFESTTAATTYEWIIRSTPGNGERSNVDVRAGRCLEFGDIINLQVNSLDNAWLNGGRESRNKEVYTGDRFGPSFLFDGQSDDYERVNGGQNYEWIVLKDI